MEKTGVDVEVCLNLKPEKIGSQTFFLHEFPSKRWSKSGFYSLLRLTDGKVSVDVFDIYYSLPIWQFRSSCTVIDVTN